MFNQSRYPGMASNVAIPDDQYIADFIISEIRLRQNESSLYDYALSLLSEDHFKNSLVDDLIERPKLLLEYIAENPNEVPTQARFDNALAGYVGITAVRTVEHDSAFINDLKRSQRHLLIPIAEEEADIKDLLTSTGYLEIQRREPEKIGGYTPRNNQKPPVNVTGARRGRETKIKPRKVETSEPRYEPRIKPTAPQRPMLRAKENFVQDGKMAYADHSTFNRLAITETDIKAKPNFFAGVQDPENILDDSGFAYALVEDLSVTCHSQATALAWANTLNAKSDLRLTSTIMDVTYQTIQIADTAVDNATRELALMNIGPGGRVLEGNLATFGALVDAMEQLRDSAVTSSTAELLLRTINRRATVAVNQMLRYDLAVEKQYITDFLVDWYPLRQYLVNQYSEKSVVTELSKYERTTVTRILNISAPKSDEADDLTDTTYSNELLQRSIITADNHFTTVLPISSGRLGFALEDRTSYICHTETPEVYNYLLAIIRRAEEHAPLYTYESISITTIDKVRFNIRLTEVQNIKTRVATKPYLAITFVDFQ